VTNSSQQFESFPLTIITAAAWRHTRPVRYVTLRCWTIDRSTSSHRRRCTTN